VQTQIDVGAVVRKVFDIYVDQASVLMPAAAVVFVLTRIITTLLVAASPGLALIALPIYLVATTLYTGMVVELVADVQDGKRDARPAQLLRAVRPVLVQLILVGIVTAIGVLVGLIFLIIPAFIVLTIWFVAAPVVVLERPGVFASLSRSRALVRGNGWRVFGVILVLILFVGAVGYVLEAVAESAGSGAGIVASVVVGILSAPLSALAASVLYFELGGRARSQLIAPQPQAPDPFGR